MKSERPNPHRRPTSSRPSTTCDASVCLPGTCVFHPASILATIPVEIALAHPQGAGSLDDAPVQVQISGAGVRNALIVPVGALLSLAHGRYAVETIAANGSHHLVPVTLGLINQAQDVAQVSAARLRDGEQIVVPST